LEGVGDLRRVAERLVDGERSLREARSERLPLDQLHDEVRGPLLLPDVVERADVRMVEAGDGPRLALEPRSDLGVRREVRGKHLHRDDAIEARVARAVDLAHTAGP